MPITAFQSFSDGIDPNRRGRGHFMTHLDVDDERLWIPYAEGVWFQPCFFDLSAGSYSLVLKALPGATLGTHYHVGSVQGYTLRGHWRYLEHDWVATPGSFIYEPAGEAHTLVIADDSPEPALIFFSISGALIYLDKPVGGSFLAYDDAFTALEFCRAHYRQAGLDERTLDALVR